MGEKKNVDSVEVGLKFFGGKKSQTESGKYENGLVGPFTVVVRLGHQVWTPSLDHGGLGQSDTLSVTCLTGLLRRMMDAKRNPHG